MGGWEVLQTQGTRIKTRVGELEIEIFDTSAARVLEEFKVVLEAERVREEYVSQRSREAADRPGNGPT